MAIVILLVTWKVITVCTIGKHRWECSFEGLLSDMLLGLGSLLGRLLDRQSDFQTEPEDASESVRCSYSGLARPHVDVSNPRPFDRLPLLQEDDVATKDLGVSIDFLQVVSKHSKTYMSNLSL